MYLDGVVVFGLVIVTLTCIMITYVGVYAYKHIKAESAKYDADMRSKAA